MVRKRDVLLMCMVAMHAALGMPNQGGKVNPSECRSLMDLYFVIDGSDSIDADNFKLLQEAVASMIPEIELGRNKARIGMLVYSSGVPLSSKHSFSYDPNYLYNAAMTLEHPRDGTKTSLAIQHMREIFQADGRKNVPWVCVVITDGISKNPPATIMEAKLAAKMGISMFAVGIGQKIAIKELEGIASTQNQVMAINDFSELRNILQSMMFRICPCPTPPVVPLAKCDDGPRAIGSVRSYQCMDGYLQRGNPTIQCQSDFTWTPLAHDFQCIPCSETTPFLEHGTCGGGDLTIGASRIYSCNLGYRGIGNPVIECLKDATWSTPKFECVPCGPPPHLPHANCGGDDLRIGAVRTYECELGYRLIGKKTIECMDNKDWLRPQWSKPDFKCVPCGETPSVQYGICGGGLDTIGAVRTFECEPGYRLIGKKTIVCQDNIEWLSPRWSKPDFKCVPCGETPSVQYGICGGGLDTIGAVRTFECEPGYRLIGKKTIVCQDNIEWSSPRWSKPDFKCVPCGETPTVQYGICGGGLDTIGAVRTFECEPGYRLIGKKTIVCQDNIEWLSPRWSKPDFKCVPCGETPTVQYGICGGGLNTIGAVRTFECEPGYRLIGKKTIECQDNIEWSSPRWSKPDFKCVPCGETPSVQYGICGGGLDTIGAVRTFECEPGYRLIGKKTIVCQDNIEWSSPRWSKPDFKCVPCGETPTVQYGICGGGLDTIGAVRTFECEPGYRLIGKKTIVCQDNIEWSSPRWSKPDFKCVPCGETPSVQYGICGGGLDTIGAVRTFECEPGYRLIGKKTIVCQDNIEWSSPRWSKPDFKCVPCGETPTVQYGICGGGLDTIGAVRTFECEPGYRLIGKKTIECQDNIEWLSPRWSKPDLKCVPCGETPTVQYGICGGGLDTIGAVRTFECEPGYRLIGKKTIECQDNIEWSSPRWSKPDFKCVPCGETPTVQYGICGGGLDTIGAVRTFECEPGYRLIGKKTIECQDNIEWLSPRWSKPDFKCVPCGETPTVQYGICGGGLDTIGAVRTFECEPGYRLIGKKTIECQDNIEWSSPRWSKPDFKCVPCGETPTVQYGICGGGLDTIGAVRTFECEPGYRLIGKKTIECQDNTEWLSPRWSKPDFKCVPCGETPTVQYGICGGGLDTIGAVRTFECEPGYRLIGKKTIECQDNIEWLSPRWSKPDFKCVPCGETPSVQFGICGGGLDTIGAVRTFECEPGYRLIGKKTIECQDNIEWPTPRWSKPDVQCVPCGDTPAVQHGICGGGLNTIGAVRTFECEPGYHLVGKKTIECQDNKEWPRPRWSEPDVQCIPCGKTPVVDFATCNEGENLIGSRRKYTCTEGYFMHGTPEIICLNDGTWSKPNLTCKDCGDPPRVPNAYTGTGPSLRGSKRVYYCESGFDMIGRGEIVCDGTGHWETPRFRCEGTSLKPLTTDPNVCDGCRYLNGVGYNHHPFDCNQYVQCFLGNKGLEPVFRKCPFGLFWDQNVLTCRPSHEVDCRQDRCKDLTVHSYKHADRDNCCAYWKCQGGKSYGECCGEGSSYDPVLQQCVTDYECVNECPFHDELPVCDKRPGDVDTMFEQHIGKNVWVPMDCAPGTVFNPVDCDCSLYLMTIPGKTRQQVCKPELYLPFTDGFNDRSGKNVFVKPENISIRDGAAFFNGHSRIMINRFANTEFTGDLVIKFRYNEYKNGDYFNKLQALVTNGDCGSDPSIVVAKMPGYVLLGANTDTPKSFALPTLDKTWKEVIYIHNERKLEGRVCGAAMSKWSYGSIRATHCAVQIGYGNGLQSYVGLIDDLYIYQCRPRSSLLTINY